jgi:predicted nucleotidyltransferase
MEKANVSIDSKKKIFNAIKNALLKKDEIIFAYLHGSFLDGPLFNDIDIALYLDDKKIHGQENLDYCEQLNMELSHRIGFAADVHIMNRAPLGFQHSVLKYGQLLFSKNDELRSDLIEKTSREYMDFYELSLQYIRDIVYHGN